MFSQSIHYTINCPAGLNTYNDNLVKCCRYWNKVDHRGTFELFIVRNLSNDGENLFQAATSVIEKALPELVQPSRM